MGYNPSETCGVGLLYPVYNITWYEAVEYCNRKSIAAGLAPSYSYSTFGTNPNNWPAGWGDDAYGQQSFSCNWSANGYRLPTEMEFMYAAKGGANTPASGYNHWSGTDIEGHLINYAWYLPESNSPNYGTKPIGTKLPNQLGLYDMSGNLYEWCWDVLGNLPTGNVTNPHGPASGIERTYRGGFWGSDASLCRVNERYYSVAKTLGVGLASELPETIPDQSGPIQ